MVGANQDDDAGSSSGSAYVFVRANGAWSEQSKLTADDAAVGDFFGFSAALTGDVAVVGASQDKVAGVRTGSAYVFVRSAGTWTQYKQLVASDGGLGDQFALSVSADGVTAISGAFLHDGTGNNAGAAYVYSLPSATPTLADLAGAVTGLDLPKGLENALTAKVDTATAALERGQDNAAVNNLEAFINQVEAQSGKKIDEADAQILIDLANRIIADIQGG
jgi:hypothetical protein